mmetsp:Transcript_2639/g.5822  ORF Transcript_2639/g.5822 Transcript_2639/m.5822 type:complete len:318 (+) Transcript_2639:316-1269(+)
MDGDASMAHPCRHESGPTSERPPWSPKLFTLVIASAVWQRWKSTLAWNFSLRPRMPILGVAAGDCSLDAFDGFDLGWLLAVVLVVLVELVACGDDADNDADPEADMERSAKTSKSVATTWGIEDRVAGSNVNIPQTNACIEGTARALALKACQIELKPSRPLRITSNSLGCLGYHPSSSSTPNGPRSNSTKFTPKLQTSAASELQVSSTPPFRLRCFSRKTSGAQKGSDPQQLVRWCCSLTSFWAKPKSASRSRRPSSLTIQFEGLISRWQMRWECKCAIAVTSCFPKRSMTSTGRVSPPCCLRCALVKAWRCISPA